jgi:hypothetical protein
MNITTFLRGTVLPYVPYLIQSGTMNSRFDPHQQYSEHQSKRKVVDDTLLKIKLDVEMNLLFVSQVIVVYFFDPTM